MLQLWWQFLWFFSHRKRIRRECCGITEIWFCRHLRWLWEPVIMRICPWRRFLVCRRYGFSKQKQVSADIRFPWPLSLPLSAALNGLIRLMHQVFLELTVHLTWLRVTNFSRCLLLHFGLSVGFWYSLHQRVRRTKHIRRKPRMVWSISG